MKRFLTASVTATITAFLTSVCVVNLYPEMVFSAEKTPSETPIMNNENMNEEEYDDTPIQLPYPDAVALWDFETLEDQRAQDGNVSRLQAFGDVEIGVPSESSMNGYVARFSGKGWLSAGQGAGDELNLHGSNMTIFVRLRLGTISGSYPILSKHGGHANMAYNIFAFPDYIGTEIGTTGNGYTRKITDESASSSTQATRTVFTRRPLSGRALFSEMEYPETVLERWHEVVVRVNEAKMELFVDGRCVDEDFVVGELAQNSVPLLFGAQDTGNGGPDAAHPETLQNGFIGEMDTVAIWNRCLTDEEIMLMTAYASGQDSVDMRERTDRGNGESMQYWIPPNSYFVGDCMPFYQDGVFHCLYLLDKGHHSAKNGKGAHQWIQATSTDLVNWMHQPFVVPITEQNEGSICTGSVFYHKGKYYAFYANRSMDRGGILESSVSDDGIYFTKQPGPLVEMPEGYSGSLRDPVVFVNPDDGLCHMYATTSYRGRGCLAHLVSADLKTWDLRNPIYLRANDSEPECPDWFKMGDYYYLVTQHEYRYSRSPLGPWLKPAANSSLMAGMVNVPKTAPYGENRRITVGWTRQFGFGGAVVFHEVIQLPDGQLGTRFVPEMMPKTDAPTLNILNGETPRDTKNARRVWENALPREFRLELEVTFDPETVQELLDYTIELGNGKKITLIPACNAVQIDNEMIPDVDFSTGSLTIDLFVKRDLCDVCVQNTRCFTAILPEEETRTLTITDNSEILVGEYTLNAEKRPSRDSFQFRSGFTLKKLTVSPLSNR
ncbi:MAG: LamG-like jellyroll fold domain-containing protein [Planctomycetia bacterium]|nr:LamG-like jellyroll fold domain-containing protein [Planctomycetia bacterium]